MPILKVKSEVTGKVWKVTARPGDAVAKDETLLIVESMKMEILVAASASGVLKELLVAEGDEVSEDQVLAIVET
jgi:acetyl-CoA carboxylase biotin carboxyl carrier protein